MGRAIYFGESTNVSIKLFPWLLILIPALTSCGGGSGGGGSGGGGSGGGNNSGNNDEQIVGGEQPTNILASRTVLEVCSRWNSDWPERATVVWTPGVSQCETGELSETAHEDAIRRLNLWRWLVGVDEVSVDQTQRQAEMEAATMMAANNLFSHTGWTPAHVCYTDAAKYAVAGSNIGFGYSSPAASVDAYIFDRGVTSLGHRRRALAYRLSTTAFGKHSDYDAMYVFSLGNTQNAPDFVSFPSPGPFPTEALLTWSFIYSAWELKTPWSFAAEPLKSDANANVVKQADGQTVPTTTSFFAGSDTRMPLLTIVPDSAQLEPDATYNISIESDGNTWNFSTRIVSCTP